MSAPVSLCWDLFCRVIDNLGDAGVCWRLAADLAARGDRVRLVIDDPAPLALIAPEGAAGVEVLRWPGPAAPGDVVVEAFGCDPPDGFVAAMAASRPPPVWINLEYLSAEAYVERSHSLPSPQRSGLCKWFYFPGFTAATGGLLREPGLMDQRTAFERDAWLRAMSIAPRDCERVISLFCYANARLPELLHDLAREPTLLLLTPGPAQQQVTSAPSGVRLHRLPWLPQRDFDRLLWSCDINFVRGEDSPVRALWAGAPFVWQLYPQTDGAHAVKLHAMLQWLAAPPDLAALWRAWNGVDAGTWPGLPALPQWQEITRSARMRLLGHDDLCSQLRQFAIGKRGC